MNARAARRLLSAFAVASAAVVATATADVPPSISCSLNFVSGRLVPGGSVTLLGWAVDVSRAEPVREMEVRLDDDRSGDVLLSGHRPDVAEHFGDGRYLWSGFTAMVSLRGVRPGPHRVSLTATSRNGERISCAEIPVTVRDFPQSVEPSPGHLGLTLLLRTALFIGWLVFVGWAPMRLCGPRAVPLAPSVGLCLFAVAAEAGAAVNVRPLGSASALTIVSALLLVVSVCRRRVRANWTGRGATLGFAALFALAGGIPLVSHGPGAVLGTITDATWESSVADSIARYGWTVPRDVHGLLAAVPAAWRAADFRAGVPYPLALLSQAFGVRAHEAHAVLTLAAAVLLIWGTGALARHVFRGRKWVAALAVSLTTLNSVLFAQLYHQHTGVLIATVLYVAFVFCLIAVLRLRPVSAMVPIALLLAGAWTLYPETMILWALTGAIALVVYHPWRAAPRNALRLAAAVVIAALLNPVAFARTVRFTNALRHASALASPELRTTFGDTHYFPSVAVIAGIRPYRIDSPAPAGPVDRAVALAAGSLSLAAAGLGALSARRRDLRLVVLLVAPTAAWLLGNRLWEFPYGYSKGLPHMVPVGSVALALLLSIAAASPGRPWRNALATAAVAFVVALSAISSFAVISRAVRGVPGYDPAFRTLPALLRGLDRDAVIVVSDPLDWRREWIAYFAGEYRIVRTREEAAAAGARMYELVDRRGEAAAVAPRVVRSSALFLLTRP